MKKLSENRMMSITGLFMAMSSARDFPIVINIEGVEFIPVYSTENKLHADIQRMWDGDYVINQIEDGKEFLESLLPHYRVAKDPYTTEEGNTRFTEITLP